MLTTNPATNTNKAVNRYCGNCIFKIACTKVVSKETGRLSSVRNRVVEVNDWLNSRIVGQQELTQRLLIALLCGGHLLVEGAPGLAKTRAVKELARCIDGDFHRIQFTPDLLPSDVTGTEVFRPEDGSIHFQKGPIFHNLVLADEVNRAPAKVQSALLEGMAEHQVTQGRETFALPDLFLVMATQNPIEQEGTYPLPEAQLDRFLLLVRVGYPDPSEERSILHIAREEITADLSQPPAVLSQSEIFEARQALSELHMSDPVEMYIVALVLHTRSVLDGLDYGGSPRATIAIDQCARAIAWLDNRDYVSPEDVQNVLFDALRHRLILSFEAEARGVTPDDVTEQIVDAVPVP